MNLEILAVSSTQAFIIVLVKLFNDLPVPFEHEGHHEHAVLLFAAEPVLNYVLDYVACLLPRVLAFLQSSQVLEIVFLLVEHMVDCV